MFFKLLLVALIALVGRVSCSLQGRVVNGINSNIEKYKFMVSVRYKGGIHACGGTILNTRWILTAAHCVSEDSPSDFSIQYGTTVISAGRTNVIKVKDIFFHKKYDLKIFDNDIALLKLEKPIVYDSKTGPVNLPNPLFEVPQHKYGVPGVSLGWGAKSDSGEMESILQEVELKIYSNKECKSQDEDFTIKLLCAGADKIVKGLCYGDSGGPLLSKDSVQLGITSFITKPCGSSFAIFTKVSHFRAWIDATVGI